MISPWKASWIWTFTSTTTTILLVALFSRWFMVPPVKWMKTHGVQPLFSSVFLLSQAWPVVGTWCASVAHHPSSFLFPPPLSFLPSLRKQMAFTVGYFPFQKKGLFDILSSGTAWGKCDLAQGIDLVGDNSTVLPPPPLPLPFLFFFFLKSKYLSTYMEMETLCGPDAGTSPCFPCFFPPSSHPVLFLLSPMCITHPSLTHPRGPSFQHRAPSPGPSHMQSRCQPRQGGQQQPHKEANRVLGGKSAHSPTLHVVPFCVSSLLHLHAYALHTCAPTHTLFFFFSTYTVTKHTHPVDWVGAGDRESWNCLSVISIPAGGSWPRPDIWEEQPQQIKKKPLIHGRLPGLILYPTVIQQCNQTHSIYNAVSRRKRGEKGWVSSPLWMAGRTERAGLPS